MTELRPFRTSSRKPDSAAYKLTETSCDGTPADAALLLHRQEPARG
jgi:hypothetical protein